MPESQEVSIHAICADFSGDIWIQPKEHAHDTL